MSNKTKWNNITKENIQLHRIFKHLTQLKSQKKD